MTNSKTPLFDRMDNISDVFYSIVDHLVSELQALDGDALVDAMNHVRIRIHQVSPFKHEPVDLVTWVRSEVVDANDYNPNSVAPPEMALLAHSILSDGFTQPIVAWPVSGDRLEVIDGFHRNRVGKENPQVRERVHGYLPVVCVDSTRTDKNDRMAATIRHNRARGKHKVDSMSDIVIELRRRKWSDARIAKELGMEQDEVLRLAQVSGLAEMFSECEFSQAWEIADES